MKKREMLLVKGGLGLEKKEEKRKEKKHTKKTQRAKKKRETGSWEGFSREGKDNLAFKIFYQRSTSEGHN